MTREELNELLKKYAEAAYWHGEETGEYGTPNPDTHKEVECKIWETIDVLCAESFQEDIGLRLSPKTDEPQSREGIDALLNKIRTSAEEHGFSLRQHGPWGAFQEAAYAEKMFIKNLLDEG